MTKGPTNRFSAIARILLALACATQTATAVAATFTVNSRLDFSDDDLSDNVCETINGNPIDGFRIECSLRGAIEQANATPGADTIEFSVAGRISPSAALGPLPWITEELSIDGSTAPGAPARDAPTAAAPTVIIDGLNLSDEDTDTGLRLSNTADGSRVINLAVVNFPRDGIFVATDSAVWITGCWVGVDPESGGAAGNRSGLSLGTGTVGSIVGRTLPGDGRGNVLSGNRFLGLRSEASFALVRGNRIGVDATGTFAIPNLGGGASFPFGNNNDIGQAAPTDLERNVIAANQLFNMRVDGDDNLVRGNFVGCGLGGSLANTGTGIQVIGNGVTVGGAEDDGNHICDHPLATAIVATAADDLTVSHNEITDNGPGISISNAARLVIANNTISGSTGQAISLSGLTGATVTANNVSQSDTAIELFSASNNQIADNVLLQNVRGIQLNSVSDNNMIAANEVTHGAGEGIDINGSDGNQVSGNLIADNLDAGVIVRNGAIGNTISENQMSGNGGLGIDLGDDGPTANDPGDPDSGPNNRQNVPLVSLNGFTVGLKGGAGGPEVDLSYQVDSTSADSAYPLSVEFFLSTTDTPDQGEDFLVALNYNSPQMPVNVAIGLPPGTTSGWIVATATDADGNTSEFSATVGFGLPEDVFADGFESP